MAALFGVRGLMYLLGFLAVIAPYIALNSYVPKYKSAKAEVSRLEKQADALLSERDTLRVAVSAATAATDAMRAAQVRADGRRRVAETTASKLAADSDSRILQLQLKLKEPTNADIECRQLKDIIDSYAK